MNLFSRFSISSIFFFTLICFYSGKTQAILEVNEFDNFYTIAALFGGELETPITAELLFADDNIDVITDACDLIENNVAGKIALVDRGNCFFEAKAINAEMAGALAVIVCNDDAANPNILPFMDGDDGGALEIPVSGMTYGDCQRIRTALDTRTLEATLLPSFNNLCFEAQAITPGTYQVDTIYPDPVLEVLGGMPSQLDGATASVWYTYTPTEDGLMKISSCLGGADTRLWIHTGSCDLLGLNLTTILGNDDACFFEIGNNEDPYASNIELPVQANVTYYIEWDDRWESFGFEFTLEFEAVEIAFSAGQVCDQAIPIEPGNHTVERISPFGQTGLDNVNGSEWYSINPTMDGVLSISSCGGGADTRLFLYEGNCENLMLVAGDESTDNVCAAFEGDEELLAAALENIAVKANQTYYLEWSGRWDISGFDFDVQLEPLPLLNIPLAVDMNNTAITENGASVAWAINSNRSLQLQPLQDNDNDGIWETTVAVNALDTLNYIFVNDSAFDSTAVEQLPLVCTKNIGLSFRVRTLIAEEAVVTSSNIVCFNTCEGKCISCQEPAILLQEGFETYQLGPVGAQSTRWTTWNSGAEGSEEDGIIADEQVIEGSQALKIEGNNGPQDVLLLLGDLQSGHFILSWQMFVPISKSAYYNIQKFQNEPGAEYGMQIAFDGEGQATLDADRPRAKRFSYEQGKWLEVLHYIDLNNNDIRLYIEDDFIYSWQMTSTTFNTSGINQLGAVNFFPTFGEHLFYVDNISLAKIPDAQTGFYPQTAIEIQEGNHNIPAIDCFGANFQLNGENGRAGYWYEYQATADGYIAINNCSTAVNSRVWVFGDGQQNLELLGINDDQCGESSYREVPVFAGETYFIVFDDIHTKEGFDWELSFFEAPLPPQQFCESAQAIAVGITSIDSLDGQATVAANQIGINASITPTPFASSKWFAYTPQVDGIVSLFSCTATDAVAYVYEGLCGMESLELMAGGIDNGCPQNSSLRNIEVKANTTYYIEWTSVANSRAGFDFELSFFNPLANITFEVDMRQLVARDELSAQGAYVGGNFNDGSSVQMEDLDGDNIFSLTLPLPKNDTSTFLFYNGPFSGEVIDTTLGGNCLLATNNQRFIVIEEADQTLPIYCFGFCADCETVTSTTAYTDTQIQIYPNPTDGLLLIDNLWKDNVQIEVINSLGKTQLIQSVKNKKVPLDLSTMPSGVYWIVLSNAKQSVTRKVLLEK